MKCGNYGIDAISPLPQDGFVGTRHVVVVAFPGVQPLDAVGPIEVFAGARRGRPAHSARTRYSVTLASTDGQPVKTESGIALCTVRLPDPNEPIDTLVIAGGNGIRTARHDAQLISWIRTVAPTCRRVTTVCTGAFLTAEAGLLGGRRVTTHWANATRLETEFPDVSVDPDPIYIKDGKYWTSAGVTARA